MKRLPLNPREDADVKRTGEFPDATEPARPYVNPICENCKHWKRDRWDAEYVKRWGPAPSGDCSHPAHRACVSGMDEDGVEHFSRYKTGHSATCKHWNA